MYGSKRYWPKTSKSSSSSVDCVVRGAERSRGGKECTGRQSRAEVLLSALRAPFNRAVLTMFGGPVNSSLSFIEGSAAYYLS